MYKFVTLLVFPVVGLVVGFSCGRPVSEGFSGNKGQAFLQHRDFGCRKHVSASVHGVVIGLLDFVPDATTVSICGPTTHSVIGLETFLFWTGSLNSTLSVTLLHSKDSNGSGRHDCQYRRFFRFFPLLFSLGFPLWSPAPVDSSDYLLSSIVGCLGLLRLPPESDRNLLRVSRPLWASGVSDSISSLISLQRSDHRGAFLLDVSDGFYSLTLVEGCVFDGVIHTGFRCLHVRVVTSTYTTDKSNLTFLSYFYRTTIVLLSYFFGTSIVFLSWISCVNSINGQNRNL